MVGERLTYSPFRPGMTATVDIITKTKKNILAVPISSVVVKTLHRQKKLRWCQQRMRNSSKSDKKFECVFVKVGDKAK
jgi:HlyD family secretion protein